jgi:hypothetical protein
MPITLLTLLYIQGLVENLRSRHRKKYFQQSGVYMSRIQHYSGKEYGPTQTYEVALLGARLEVRLISLQNRATETPLLDDVPGPRFSLYCIFLGVRVQTL